MLSKSVCPPRSISNGRLRRMPRLEKTRHMIGRPEGAVLEDVLLEYYLYMVSTADQIPKPYYEVVLVVLTLPRA